MPSFTEERKGESITKSSVAYQGPSDRPKIGECEDLQRNGRMSDRLGSGREGCY